MEFTVYIILLYYCTLFNYLNHSTTFFKYVYNFSKTLKWVTLISQYTPNLQ